ncbi:Frataxin-like domain containing protein [Naviculisporaceae sp. PSN 640]
MMRPSFSKVARAASRGLQSSRIARLAPANVGIVSVVARPGASPKFMTTTASRNGITPDNKAPKEPITPNVAKTPADITDSVYHLAADEYLERLVTHLENLQDEREDIDVEYSAGVLTANFGPDIGTYVINKQPPNKQIWLSSPKSGPKRYDYVIMGDSQGEKEGTGTGQWMYLRDNSTIDELFLEELNIDLSSPIGHLGE